MSPPNLSHNPTPFDYWFFIAYDARTWYASSASTGFNLNFDVRPIFPRMPIQPKQSRQLWFSVALWRTPHFSRFIRTYSTRQGYRPRRQVRKGWDVRSVEEKIGNDRTCDMGAYIVQRRVKCAREGGSNFAPATMQPSKQK